MIDKQQEFQNNWSRLIVTCSPSLNGEISLETGSGRRIGKIRPDREATLPEHEGSPEDIARTTWFLFESPNITGAFLPVDGGYRFGI